MMEKSLIFVEGGSRRQRELAFGAASFAWMKLMPRIRKCVINIEIKNMKDYVIEVDKKLSLGDNFLTTVFHEMVHVKQYVRKELYSDCNFYDTREEYLNLPWEVEAYRVQEELLDEWKSRNIRT